MSKFIEALERYWPDLVIAFRQHIQISYSAVLIGAVIAVPLGIFLTRHKAVGKKILAVFSMFQTIPSMVLFGIFIPLTGIGRPTAMLVLILYSLLPILRNTYTGISEVSDDYIEAATGMGMSSMQVLMRVELPIALPVIITGIQLSCVYVISWSTVAAMIGAGGLGDLIYTGLGRYNANLILIGAIPSSLLAIASSFLIGQLAKAATPKGMRQ